MLTSKFDTSADRGDAPIRRIFDEQPVYADSLLHIVLDREPIVDEHFLALGLGNSKSLADVANPADIADSVERFVSSASPGSYLLFERGRAAFCTSMNTTSHGHAHILPSHLFHKDLMPRLAQHLGARSFDSLTDALEFVANTNNEYMLFGTVFGSFNVVWAPHECFEQKRFIRGELEASVTNGVSATHNLTLDRSTRI